MGLETPGQHYYSLTFRASACSREIWYGVPFRGCSVTFNNEATKTSYSSPIRRFLSPQRFSSRSAWFLSPDSNSKQCEPKMASAAREHWDLQRTSGLRCNPAGIAVHCAYARWIMVITPDMAALQPGWLPNYLFFFFFFSQHATTRVQLTWRLKLRTSVRSSICQDQYGWSSFGDQRLAYHFGQVASCTEYSRPYLYSRSCHPSLMGIMDITEMLWVSRVLSILS